MRNYLIQFIKLGLCVAIAYFVSLFSVEYIITNPDENTMLIVFYGTVCCLILGEVLRSNDSKDWCYGIANLYFTLYLQFEVDKWEKEI